MWSPSFDGVITILWLGRLLPRWGNPLLLRLLPLTLGYSWALWVVYIILISLLQDSVWPTTWVLSWFWRWPFALCNLNTPADWSWFIPLISAKLRWDLPSCVLSTGVICCGRGYGLTHSLHGKIIPIPLIPLRSVINRSGGLLLGISILRFRSVWGLFVLWVVGWFLIFDILIGAERGIEDLGVLRLVGGLVWFLACLGLEHVILLIVVHLRRPTLRCLGILFIPLTTLRLFILYMSLETGCIHLTIAPIMVGRVRPWALRIWLIILHPLFRFEILGAGWGLWFEFDLGSRWDLGTALFLMRDQAVVLIILLHFDRSVNWRGSRMHLWSHCLMGGSLYGFLCWFLRGTEEPYQILHGIWDIKID